MMRLQEPASEPIANMLAEVAHSLAAVDQFLPFSPFPTHSAPVAHTTGTYGESHLRPNSNAPNGHPWTKSPDAVLRQ
jgi:hypothetical protein